MGKRLNCFYNFVCIMQEDTDPDKLKPYKKDLEYLDDHFQVFNTQNELLCVYMC